MKGRTWGICKKKSVDNLMFISGILRLHLVVEMEQWGALPKRDRRGRGFIGGAFGGGRPRRLRSSGHQLQRRHNTSKFTENNHRN